MSKERDGSLRRINRDAVVGDGSHGGCISLEFNTHEENQILISSK